MISQPNHNFGQRRSCAIRAWIRKLMLARLGLAVTCVSLVLCFTQQDSFAEPNRVQIKQDPAGWRLLVDEKPLMVLGMNWGYIPIGQNYSWVSWQQPESVIKEVLETDMALLKDMGVNAIRQYP